MVKSSDSGTISRRDALKAAGGVAGGLALTSAAATPVAAQAGYYRYESVRVRLVDAGAQPPRFRTVKTTLYLTQPRLADCDADDPCRVDVLDYRRTQDDDDGDGRDDNDEDGADDDDDNGGDDDNGDDSDDNNDDDDDDDACPGFASVVLLCNADADGDAVVLRGLLPDVLGRFYGQGFDHVVDLSPSDATNLDAPQIVSNPCPAVGDDDDDGSDDDGSDDDGSDDDGSGEDTGGDDDGGDDNDDGGANGDDDGDDDNDGGASGDDDGSDDDGDDNDD